MNKKNLKIALNVAIFVLEAVGSYLREKRHAELEARVAELELRSNTRDRLMAQKNRDAIKDELAKGASLASKAAKKFPQSPYGPYGMGGPTGF